MCLLKLDLTMLCQAYLNSRVCRVASPTTTNINTQSTNDNNPVNHQPIRHSKILELQRRISELDIRTPDNS